MRGDGEDAVGRDVEGVVDRALRRTGKRTIDLRGPDGNAYVVLGMTRRYMSLRGDSSDQIEQMTGDATSGDYQRLLDVCQQAVGWDYVGRPERD